MNLNAFYDIIDFAIEREKEAAKFYKVLQDIALFDAQKSILHNFELMEEGHIDILNDIKLKGVEKNDIKNFDNIDLNTYHFESELTENMSYCDIIKIGLNREETSGDLYNKLESSTNDRLLKKTFAILKSEEQKHRQFFQTIYKNNSDKKECTTTFS